MYKHSLKSRISNCIYDLVTSFIYYDRKEDQYLPLGDIEHAIESGEITIDEMVDEFRKHLEDNLK